MNDVTILTDIDDTCLNWMDGFISYMNKRNGSNIQKVTSALDYNYMTWENFFGVEPGTMQQYIVDFNENSWEFGCLNPIHSADSYMQMLHKDFGVKFVGISSCSNSANTKNLRMANLHHVFGMDVFEDVYCLGLGESKIDVLKKFDTSIWIEDRPQHAIAGSECGHHSILLDDPRVKKDLDLKIPDHIIQVENWYQVYYYCYKILLNLL